jgi:acetyl-CoA decarbonylase/synthase complex subunit gamma
METSDQNCGCSKTNTLVSITGMEGKQKSCHASAEETHSSAMINRNFIIGTIQTPAEAIPQVSTRLDASDYLGAVRVRWGIKRDRYRVDPGLYAVGTPHDRSDVLVTANYKLTFDIARKNLEGMNVWLLVLDTKGVNVWCAAGKGTFGTKELVQRIQSTSLNSIVTHKRILLPQLGATGIAAHLVKESSGFTVIYGPVRASDIQSFIHAGYKATKEMRRVNFGWYDRIKLIPNDIIFNLRYLLSLLVIITVISGINTSGYSIQQALRNIFPIAKNIAAGYFAGLILTPLFLPYIPTQNFSFKGLIAGAGVSALLFLNQSLDGSLLAQFAEIFFIMSFSSFLAMNFTGASTFTSLAGVKKEMRIAVPIQIAFGAIATILVVLQTLFS